MKKVLVLLAEGFEEIEALTPVDYLRRAGAELVTAGLGGNFIKGSHNICVQSDCVLDETLIDKDWDAVIVPGGGLGSKNLGASQLVGKLLKEQSKKGTLICAICAAPVVVLAKNGLLKNKNYTCYLEMEKDIETFAGADNKEAIAGAKHSTSRVVVDGKIITARGAGVAEEFAFAIVEALFGAKAKEDLRAAIVAR